jgi:hypothetical protein
MLLNILLSFIKYTFNKFFFIYYNLILKITNYLTYAIKKIIVKSGDGFLDGLINYNKGSRTTYYACLEKTN